MQNHLLVFYREVSAVPVHQDSEELETPQFVHALMLWLVRTTRYELLMLLFWLFDLFALSHSFVGLYFLQLLLILLMFC